MKVNKHNAYRALIRGRLQDLRQHPAGLWERIKYAIYLIFHMTDAIVITDIELEKALRDE
jgi:hypothetical protein